MRAETQSARGLGGEVYKKYGPRGWAFGGEHIGMKRRELEKTCTLMD